MCGIWCLLKKQQEHPRLGDQYTYFNRTKKRGPDRSVFLEFEKFMLGFHRLSILDTTTNGDQPFRIELGGRVIYCVCNGEIYNFQELITKYDLHPSSHSDCEIIPLLYLIIGLEAMLKELIGEYAFIIVDVDETNYSYTTSVARDRFGVRPLFYCQDALGASFCSELKGLEALSQTDNEYLVEQFKAGHYMVIKSDSEDLKPSVYTPYYDISQITPSVFDLDEAKKNIRELLTEAVKTRLHADRPIGCLLSGGLDSSLVASIASRILKEEGQTLNTFSVGMPNSTDEKYAKLVAKHIGSNHTHYELSQEKWLDELPNIVKIIESYDITTVRASTGNYLIPKLIADNTDIKVLLIGDGSDELTSGYLYFHKAPSPEESHQENVRLLKDINYFDGLRADRGIANNSIEARVPFLDHRFVDYYLSVDPKLRIPRYGLEKWLLRESFREGDYLPEEVLIRRKEAFSDGVSSKENSWFEIIQNYVNIIYTDDEFLEKSEKYTHNKPPSKEALYYREIFETYYGTGQVEQVIPYFWLPKWSGDIKEPSARVLDEYKK